MTATSLAITTAPPAGAMSLRPSAAALKHMVAALLGAGVVGAALAAPTGELAVEARAALAVTGLALIGWTLTRISDAVVAILCAVAAVALGVLPAEALHNSLGHPMIWLMLSAFVIAAALTSSGLAERLALAATRPLRSVRGLFYGVGAVIVLTAFVIPSTSGRAALLLPVYLALVGRLPDPRLARPFALLFPTTILLSAGGSLIGAGAHVIAADMIARSLDTTVGMATWSLLALPFALLTCLLAIELILLLFVPAASRGRRLSAQNAPRRAVTPREVVLAAVMLAVVGLWITVPLHGLSAPAVALIGAAAALAKPLSGLKTKDAFRKVDVELLVFLAATMTLAEGMRASGADVWLADRLFEAVPAALAGEAWIAIALAAAVATGFHLVVASRSARAAVLIPALGAPLAGLGHDPALIALVIVLGTGFCQTLPASAKPVALFAGLEGRGVAAADLLRLAAVLGPVMIALLVVFGVSVWPPLLAMLRS